MTKLMTTIGLPVVLAAGLGSQAFAAAPPERLFLQQVSTHSALVKWRGDAGAVCFSTKMKDLKKKKWPRCVNGVETELGHLEARLTGLAPDKTYYYSVAGLVSEDQQFRTAPNSNKPPRDGNTHILIVGDSGTQTEGGHDGEAAAVLAGFETYNAANGGEPVDIFLALGDNAYVAGTDAQWQGAFFDIYPGILKSAQVLPTIGNHEMGSGPVALCLLDPRVPCPPVGPVIAYPGLSISPDPESYDGNRDTVPDGTGIPYLDIFSLPANGESGGVASGTEQYYSADYGNVHIVSLDTQLSARDDAQFADMKAWLEADLSANSRDWTVVIFHHPPYSKGANHNSDTPIFIDIPQIDMREQFTPIFEAHGVDVVYSGHSHSYERSYYLRGHTGISDTFDAAIHAELNADNEPSLGNGRDEYEQLSPTSGGIDDRVVYTVAGSSGKHDERGDRDTGADWLQHEAHIPQAQDVDCTGSGADGSIGCRGLAVRGSVVLDASATSLTARFVDENGMVRDQFTINR